MFERLNAELPLDARDDITFEFIQHRFTKPAKSSEKTTDDKTRIR